MGEPRHETADREDELEQLKDRMKALGYL
jgi:hypothetical protein